MGYDTWYMGSFVITPPISAALAGEMEEDYEPWLFTPDALSDPENGVRGSDEAEESLAGAVKKLTALGHTLTGTIEWEWNGDEFVFGKFEMSGNTLYHCDGLRVYDTPKCYPAQEGSTP